jgi:hypothetical protein
LLEIQHVTNINETERAQVSQCVDNMNEAWIEHWQVAQQQDTGYAGENVE